MSAISSSSTPWTVTGTGSIETGTVRTGRKAIKLSGDGSVHQTLTGLQANGWYVLSAYVNTGGVSSFGTNGGVYMASGILQGEPIRWDTSGVGDGWERIYVVAQADANGSLAVDACASGIQGSVITRICQRFSLASSPSWDKRKQRNANASLVWMKRNA